MRTQFHANVEFLEDRDVPTAGLAITLSTDHHVYRPGQPVVITLTEKNVTNHVIHVGVGPTLGGFTVSQGGREVWFSDNPIQAQFILEKTLRPGESLKQRATWHGQTPEGKPAHRFGPYVVESPGDPAAMVVIGFVPPVANPGLNLRTHPLGGRISR